MRRRKSAGLGLDGTPNGALFDVWARAIALAPPPSGATGVVVCDDTGAVFRQDWSGTVDPFTFVIAGASSICRWHSLFIAAAPASSGLVEWGDDVQSTDNHRRAPIRSCRQDGHRWMWTTRRPVSHRMTLSGASMRASAATISLARPAGARPSSSRDRRHRGAGVPYHGAREVDGNVVATQRFSRRPRGRNRKWSPVAVTGPSACIRAAASGAVARPVHRKTSPRTRRPTS